MQIDVTCRVLVVAGAASLVGCVDSSSTSNFRPITDADAKQSQQALDQGLEPDTKNPTTASPTLIEPSSPTVDQVAKDETKTGEQKVEVSETKSVESVAAVKPTVDAQPTDATTMAADQSTEPAEKTPPKLLVTEKRFPTTAPDSVLRVSYDDIDPEKIFDLKEVARDTPQYFPQWLRDLNGQRIRIRGFMIPPFQSTDLVGFTLARDTSACCFGPKPKVCYLIDVTMKSGKTTDYIVDRAFDVVGTFEIGDEVAPGKLYTIKDAIVIPR